MSEGREDCFNRNQLPRMPNNKANRGRGFRGKNKVHYSDKGREGNSNKNHAIWQKVIVKNGGKYDRQTLLKVMIQRSAIKFVPLVFETRNNFASFYVEDAQTADAIKDLNNLIEMGDGSLLQLSVVDFPSPTPSHLNSPLEIALLKQVMSARYQPASRALDLSRFHHSFAGESFFVPLYRSTILDKVFEIVVECIPEVCAIDLSDNQLTRLDPLLNVRSRLDNLVVLHAANNKIKDLKSISKLADTMKLEELKLEGNPVKKNLGESYVELMQGMFPALKVLDGHKLPKKICFEQDTNHTFADQTIPSVSSLIKDESAGETVLQFMNLYFKLYNSEDWASLREAYAEPAVMSMSMYGRDRSDNFKNNRKYCSKSRNLLRQKDPSKSISLLHVGPQKIVHFLSMLPRVTHETSTLTLDIPMSNQLFTIFTVTGYFFEQESNYYRHFNRCFVISPHGQGYCIVNETLHVSGMSTIQPEHQHNNEPLSRSVCHPQQLLTTNVTPPVSPILAENNSSDKVSIVMRFAQYSGMKVNWAEQCLAENNWQWDAAENAFQNLRLAGLVPPAAFQS